VGFAFVPAGRRLPAVGALSVGGLSVGALRVGFSAEAVFVPLVLPGAETFPDVEACDFPAAIGLLNTGACACSAFLDF
jgi:hypothetical protein